MMSHHFVSIICFLWVVITRLTYMIGTRDTKLKPRVPNSGTAGLFAEPEHGRPGSYQDQENDRNALLIGCRALWDACKRLTIFNAKLTRFREVLVWAWPWRNFSCLIDT